ncbi:AAA family ATPase [Candidatus Parabeggiatoa sp. HSG14]|uniref:AAA family ATPase n=1 Tax=Candidatus Parabeggiatoa sp. HSG14 TaxID=3055593 RepID=UPI0025A6D435|nr:AAA family ATPase [Thiotrichales bacterium HSG14]
MPDLEISSLHDENIFASMPHRYYLTPELSQRVNLVCHLIQNSEQLLFVLAETGCGKTSLLNQLNHVAEQQHEHWWIYTLTSNPALSPEACLSIILTAFNVRQDGKPMEVLQESLRNHVAATRYNGQLPVLFIDDAHKLPLATLKFIIESAMQGDALTRMRVVLFCEPQITSILATPEFDIVHNTLIHTLDVPPFSKTQVRDYLQFRLQNSRYNNVHPFNSDIIKKIYTESEGIPGEVNLYAQQILSQFAEQHKLQMRSHSLSHSKLLWGIPIVLVLIAIALWVYWYSPKPPENTLQPQSTNVSLPKEPTSPYTLYDEIAIEVPETNVTPVTPPKNGLVLKSTDLSTQSIGKQANDTTLLTSSTEDLIAKNKGEQTEIKGEDWLYRQAPNAYTLQILGAYDHLTLKSFLAKYNLKEVAMFKTSHNNKDWYVLLYGIYSTRSQANAARKELPAALQKDTKPWVRSLASVQKTIKQ